MNMSITAMHTGWDNWKRIAGWLLSEFVCTIPVGSGEHTYTATTNATTNCSNCSIGVLTCQVIVGFGRVYCKTNCIIGSVMRGLFLKLSVVSVTHFKSRTDFVACDCLAIVRLYLWFVLSCSFHFILGWCIRAPLRESQVSQGKGTLVIFWFVKWKQKTMDPIKKHWLGHDEKWDFGTRLWCF